MKRVSMPLLVSVSASVKQVITAETVALIFIVYLIKTIVDMEKE
jgi:hypothetical protein